MGRPKAWLPFDDEPLISHVVRVLRHEFDDVVVVSAPAQELPALPARAVVDEVAYQGPVGGIYYGLRAVVQEICFVTACDVPFLNVALIQSLLSRSADFDVVVPVWLERLQPLHAVYRKNILPVLGQQLEEKKLRPAFLYDKVRTDIVAEAEVRRVDPEGLSFFNVNTPDDYQQAQILWRRLRAKEPST